MNTNKSIGLIDMGEPQALPARNLSLETCTKWGYHIGDYNNQRVHIANYRNEAGQLVSQKIRSRNKEFCSLGDTKGTVLYGQHLWRDKGKMLVITEGELDALSISQVQENKWPVVSLPNGAQSARKAIEKNLAWVLGFNEIILMFDNDDPGRKASQDVASVLPPGRCKIASLPLKDASDMLQAKRGRELIEALWGAKTYRPDGIVTIADVRERVLQTPTVGLPWFNTQMTSLTYGRRLGELYAIGAGTGVGKTDLLTEQMHYDLTELNEPIAVFALEQQPTETVKRLAGKLASKKFHVPDSGWTHEQLVETLDNLESGGKLFLYDSFGATDWQLIRNMMRHLAHAENVKLFYLDHLTALAAAEDDERVALERIMAEMGGLVKELNIIIHLVSHLATPEGKPHEEGGRVMIRHFKGSRSIGFWCHFMFGLERNQQAEDEGERHITTLRVLKDRFTGQATGCCVYLKYDATKGRLIVLDEHPRKEMNKINECDFTEYPDNF